MMLTTRIHCRIFAGLGGIVGPLLNGLFFLFILVFYQIGPAMGAASFVPAFSPAKEEIVAPLTSVDSAPIPVGRLAVSIPPPPGDNMVWDPVKQKWVPMEKGVNTPDPGKQTTNDKKPGKPTADDEPAK
jgi:hypothetical protein